MNTAMVVHRTTGDMAVLKLDTIAQTEVVTMDNRKTDSRARDHDRLWKWSQLITFYSSFGKSSSIADGILPSINVVVDMLAAANSVCLRHTRHCRVLV